MCRRARRCGSGRLAKAGQPRLLGTLKLEAGAGAAQVMVDGTEVNLTHLDKRYFPDGATKRDLLDYNHDVAEFLVPYLRDRPYTMKRYPDGIGEPPFFQKNVGPATPPWVKTARLPSGNARREVNYVLCDDLATLLYVVNAGCIDHNVSMSRIASPLAPDFVLLDLDPGPAVGFDAVVRVALALRAVLEDAEIAAYPKTSGATGIHIWIPVASGTTFAQSQQFAALLFRLAAVREPDLVTEIWSLAARPKNRVYLDYRQNAQGKTIPPPYSPRPRPGAPVSCPLLWREVRIGLDPARFTIRTMRRRLERHGDLFGATLPGAARETLAAMLARTERIGKSARNSVRKSQAARASPAARRSRASKTPAGAIQPKGGPAAA